MQSRQFKLKNLKKRGKGNTAPLFLPLFLTPFCLFAQIFNPELPIQIQADSASFERAQHQAIHEGNVIMTQGGHTLHAEKLIMRKNDRGQLTAIIAKGTPATLTGKLGTAHPIHASAQTIYYYPDQQLITLKGKATLIHQKDKFHGPVLNYQIDKQTIRAIRQQNERPTFTLQPTRKK